MATCSKPVNQQQLMTQVIYSPQHMLASRNIPTNRSFPAAVSLSFIGRHRTTTFTLSALDGSGLGGCNNVHQCTNTTNSKCRIQYQFHKPRTMMTIIKVTVVDTHNKLLLAKCKGLYYKITNKHHRTVDNYILIFTYVHS